MSQTQEDATYHGYVKAHFLTTSAEQHRKEHKQQIYRLMNVQPGHRVLDIGCGPGTDTIPLAHLVGPTGQVIGVDQDEAMIAEANKRAEAEGISDRVEHKLGDVLTLPFEDNHFDTCHSERVFIHLPNPEQVFAETVRVMKAGGWIAIIDIDGGSFSIDTPEVEVERRLAQVWVQLHNNGYAGRQLYGIFRQHALLDISVQILPFMFGSLSIYRHLFRLDSVASKAIETGLVRQDELLRFQTSLEEADSRDSFFGYVNFITVVGRKP